MGFISEAFKKNTKRSTCILSLDIGTEVVKALIFYVNSKKEKIIIEGIGREYQKPYDIHGSIIFNIEGVVLACKKAISKAVRMAGEKPMAIVVGISERSAGTRTETFSLKRKKPGSKIGMNELRDIISRAQHETFSNTKKNLTKKELLGGIRFIDADLVDFNIDGYKVVNPLSFSGKNINVSISNSYVGAGHYNSIKKIIERLNLDLLCISSEYCALCKAIGIKGTSCSGAIFIDIGGSTTKIAVMRNGGVEETKMFLMGGKSFTNIISKELGLEFSQAEDLKIKYSKGQIEDVVRKRIKRVLFSDFDIWLSGVKLSLKELSNNKLLPAQIFLYGGGSQLLQIREILDNTPWAEGLPFAGRAKINLLGPKYLENIIEKKNIPVDCQDLIVVSLSILVLSINSEENLPDRILKDISKSL